MHGAAARRGWLARLDDLPWWVIAGVVVAMTAAIEIQSFTDQSQTPEKCARSVVVTIAWLAAALLVRSRAPEVPLWRLLLLVSVLWVLEDLRVTGYLVVRTSGFLTQDLAGPAVVLVGLTFPTGRLVRRRDAVLLAAVAFQPAVSGFDHAVYDSHSFLYLAPEPHIWPRVFNPAMTAMSAVAVAAVFVVLLVRWVGCSPAARRVRSPAYLAGIVLAVVTVLDEVVKVGDRLGSPVFRVLGIVMAGAVPLAIVLGVARLELSRVALTQGALRLGASPDVGRLEGLLRETLGDPSVRVLRGAQPGAPGPSSVLVRDGDEVVGAVVLDPDLHQDPPLLESVQDVVGAALSVQRLSDRARSASEGLVTAVRQERSRIERDLHDGAQHRLAGSLLWMQVLEEHLKDDAQGREIAERVIGELREATRELRELAQGKTPSVLVSGGLQQAITDIASRSPITVTFSGSTGTPLPLRLEAAVYFAVAELLANAAKHSNATAITISCRRSIDELQVMVIDDGRGGADMAAGSGLQGVTSRLAAMAGTLTITSSAEGGTAGEIAVPIADTQTPSAITAQAS